MTLSTCTSDHPPFRDLVEELTTFLAKTDGEEHGFYQQFNGIDTLDWIVIGTVNGEAVACGALRKKDADRVEIKRMFVKAAYRGRGLARTILTALEQEAKQRGFAQTILETGIRQQAAVRLYEAAGYTRIPNYPPYQGVENSLCFAKSITDYYNS